jgi:hypothetical protein
MFHTEVERKGETYFMYKCYSIQVIKQGKYYGEFSAFTN